MKRLITLFVAFVIVLGVAQQPLPVRADGPTGCSIAPTRNVRVGDIARISDADSRSNRFRELPTTHSTSTLIGMIPVGGMFEIIGGPRCADGYRWWNVVYDGLTGWTSDGEGDVHFFEVVAGPSLVTPVATVTATATPRVTSTPRPTTTAPNPEATPTAINGCVLAPTRAITREQWVVITSQDERPSNFRYLPGLDSQIVAQIEVGTRIYVIGGPRCVDGYRWWRVRFDGMVGWVGDGIVSNGEDVHYLLPVDN